MTGYDTYDPPQGTPYGDQFFQGVPLSPDSLADGSLRLALDSRLFPKLGIQRDSYVAGDAAIVLLASPANPVHSADVTLTALIRGQGDRKPSGPVDFLEGGSFVPGGSGVAAVSGIATVTVEGGFGAGTHTLTAIFQGDDDVDNQIGQLNSNALVLVVS